MANQPFVVIDDFYRDPDAVRALALSLDFQSSGGAAFPGKCAVAPGRRWEDEISRMKELIPESVTIENPKLYEIDQGFFRLALAEDEATRIDGVHQDVQRWSGVIYLSRPTDCTGGVSFFRHRHGGEFETSLEFEQRLFGHLAGESNEVITGHIREYLKDLTNWEEYQRIGMKYNRLVLLMGQCFHKSEGIFGDHPENGRLTQHFEFFSPIGNEDVVFI